MEWYASLWFKFKAYMQLHAAAKPLSHKTVSEDIKTIHAYAWHKLSSKIVW